MKVFAKRTIEKVKKLSLSVKIQLVIAILCTAAIPVYAWFAYQDRIEALTKVKEPPSINLASGGEDPAVYISLENIDVTAKSSAESYEKYIVFSIEPGKYSAYDIQLTHTTNIPFTYELYRVKETEVAEDAEEEDLVGLIKYIDHSEVDEDTGKTVETPLYYSIMTNYNYATEKTTITDGEITLRTINPDDGLTGRTLGDEEDLATINRRNYTVEGDTPDEVNQYVKPLYSVARQIPRLDEETDGNSERDYFAIGIRWTPGTSTVEGTAAYWNYAFNNKETDLIYISAKQNSIETP